MNRYLSVLILAGSITALNSFSQELSYTGPVNNALADVKTIDQSVWATFNNASSLASYTNPVIAVSFQNKFSIKELSTRAIAATFPIKFGVISAGVLQSGYSKSLVTRYGISYSRSFGSSTSAFFQYNYANHKIESSNRSDGYYSAFGLTQKITSEFYMGLLIANPEQAKMNYANLTIDIPSYFNVGIMWSNNDWIRVIAEAEK
nr:hypothetical protein [uncultured Carboxylicivirga sp.]